MKKELLLSLLSLLLWGVSLAQAQPEFVKSANNISSIVEMNGFVYYTEISGSDNKLWKSDGTTAGTTLVQSFISIDKLCVANNQLFFFANEANAGYELWKSDGTTAGTTLVKDINPTGNGNGGNAYVFLWANNTLFFSATDGVNGIELWKSDGTEVGTIMIKDLNPGSGGSHPQFGYYFNGELFFDGANGMVTRELFKSDGTEAGTVLVKDIGQSTANPSFPTSFIEYNSELYFIARPLGDFTGQFNLYKTDGTEAGTINVNDQVVLNNSAPIGLHNGFLYFAGGSYSNKQLWKSDGTFSGTTLVKELNLTGDAFPQYFYSFNGLLYFTAKSSASNFELYKTNGTLAGTELVKEINTTVDAGSNPTSLIGYNNTLFFNADDGLSGPELWASDGSEIGTELYYDINPGTVGSYLGLFLESNNVLYFYAYHSNAAQKGLWKLDNSTANLDENNIENNMIIFPNPTKGKLQVKFEIAEEFKIIDLNGTVLTTSDFQQDHLIDVSTYAPGIYFIRTSEGQTVKFIKE
ncbi:MAG: ELWxxDGT repeat protein [Bacteroidota bacterium]